MVSGVKKGESEAVVVVENSCQNYFNAMGNFWSPTVQKQFKIQLLILLITMTCGQDSRETTPTPSQESGGGQQSSGKEETASALPNVEGKQGGSLAGEDGPPGREDPPSGPLEDGFRAEDYRVLSNLVLVNVLCSKLKEPVTPNCRTNRRKLDAWLLKESAQATGLGDSPNSTSISSTSTPGLVVNATTGPGVEIAREGVKNGVSEVNFLPRNLLSFLGSRSVPARQGSSNWAQLFKVFSTILQKAKSLRVSKLGLPGLKEYLLTHGLKEESLQTLLGLVAAKSVSGLHEKSNLTTIQLRGVMTAVGRVETHSLLAFGALLVIAGIISVCWVLQNVTTWRENRRARKEMRRQERASRFLHGLQQARYRQETEQVRLMPA